MDSATVCCRTDPPNSLTAFENLKKICEEHLENQYRIEVIDLIKNPQLAKDHQIIAIPTLIRKLPNSGEKDHWQSFKY